MHGCECAEHWSFDGFGHQGCAIVNDVDGHNISQPLCFVKDATKCTKGFSMSKLANVTGSTGKCENATCLNPTETTWDFCSRVEDISSFMTQNSCHCSAIWEFDDVVYNGCSRTVEDEPSWCYVAETDAGCSKASAAAGEKTHRWDLCDPSTKKPTFLTRQGCHCKPIWVSGGKNYSSCVSKAELAWPSELQQSLDTEQRPLFGHCQVFEDEHVCPASIQSDGFVVDACFMADEAEKSDLDTTFSGCHCQPAWSFNNQTFKGCAAVVEGAEVTPWCPVVEDHSACTPVSTPSMAVKMGLTSQEGLPGWNWDYCGVEDTTNTTVWQQPDHRFIPDPSEDVPDWYRGRLNNQHPTVTSSD
jgi:hypothetical protein